MTTNRTIAVKKDSLVAPEDLPHFHSTKPTNPYGPVPGQTARNDDPAVNPFLTGNNRLDDEVQRVNSDIAKWAGKPLVDDDDLARRKPVNHLMIERAKEYETQVAPIARPIINRVREFMLLEVIPLLIGTQNGLEDSVDVARLALNTEVASGPYASFFNRIVQESLKARTVHFIRSLDPPMSKEAEQLFVDTCTSLLSPGGGSHGSDLKTLLSQMLPVPSVPGSEKGNAQVPLRKVHQAKGGRKPAGAGRTGAGAKRKQPKSRDAGGG